VLNDNRTLPPFAALDRNFYVRTATAGAAAATEGYGDCPLTGTKGAPRDVVLLNAGAALFIAGEAETVRAGVARAASVIDSGAANSVLERLIRVSNGATA